MKFWELVSVTRARPDLLLRLGDRAEWQHMAEWSEHVDTLVRQQRREALDAVVPEQACRHVLAASPDVYYLRVRDDGSEILRIRRLSGTDFALAALDVLDRCDGGILAEVLEFGSARIADWPRR